MLAKVRGLDLQKGRTVREGLHPEYRRVPLLHQAHRQTRNRPQNVRPRLRAGGLLENRVNCKLYRLNACAPYLLLAHLVGRPGLQTAMAYSVVRSRS
jgi:hypothetical protein